jgi:hypothetical protein
MPDTWGSGAPGWNPSMWANAPQAVQDWMAQYWRPPMGGPQQLPGKGVPWRRGPMAGPTISGRQPLPVMRNPTDRVLTTPNTGQVGTPVPMPGGSPGGLLAQLFDPAQHAGLAYAGMANAGNKGIDYTNANSRGLTNQILGQPIPTGGFGIGTALPGGVAPQGLGTPVNVRAARLAGAAAQPAQDAALAAAGAGSFQNDMWNQVANSMRR